MHTAPDSIPCPAAPLPENEFDALTSPLTLTSPLLSEFEETEPALVLPLTEEWFDKLLTLCARFLHV